MEGKSDMNSNQEPITKKTSNNFTINDDLKENNISEFDYHAKCNFIFIYNLILKIKFKLT